MRGGGCQGDYVKVPGIDIVAAEDQELGLDGLSIESQMAKIYQPPCPSAVNHAMV